MEKYLDDTAIIGSSTTAFMPTDLQKEAKVPERILVGHPYHPSYLLPLVEICGGEQTSEDAIARAKEFYESIGKVALVSKKEASGFIVNRVNWAAYNEARKTVEEGFCSVEDIDKAIMYGPGMRMAITGQLLTISLGIEGGLRGAAAKYGGDISPADELIAQGVDDEVANRSEEIGNTIDGVADFRDKVIIEILRLQNML